MVRLLASLLLVFAPSLFAAEVLGPWRDATPAAVRQIAAPPLRAQGTAAVVLTTSGASADDVAALRAANAAGEGPAELGIVRDVNACIGSCGTASSSMAVAAAGRFQARGSILVEGASRVRLRLDGFNVPAGTRMWIYGAEGEAIAFDGSLAHAGQLWTPSVAGNTATIELDAPSEAAFRIGAIADIRPYGEVVAEGSECVTDVSCHTFPNGVDRAIAFYHFVAGTRIFGCSGGLLNNVANDGTPYFLTANHCAKSELSASSVEAFWDYRSTSCGGPAPSLESRPKSNGATLLFTSQGSDVTLLRLKAVPPNRMFLGWDARELPNGAPLFHISHPLGEPQRYSTSDVVTTGPACSSSPRPGFLYSTPAVGATDVGSSGAPVLSAEGYVVGQLKGACGPEPDNPCNRGNREVDGAFAASYASLRQFLDPAPVCAACTPNSTTTCLLGNRFRVTATYHDPYVNLSGNAKPIRFTENRGETHPEHGPIIDNAFFSFVDFFPNSVETMVRMTKGVGINNKFWIFITGFTNAQYTVSVQDTQTCATWERAIPRDSQSVVRDYEAFSLP